MIPWLSHLLLPTVTEPTTILVALPGVEASDGTVEPAFLLGIYEAFPDGRIEGDSGRPPDCPEWFWVYEDAILRGVPTYKVRS